MDARPVPARSERRQRIRFGPFALDPANARLYRGDEVVALRGKTLAVLEYLATRPGQLVTKDELLMQLWPDVHVSEDVLVGCVRELRGIFGDRRGAARFVETVYRRGYRWIAAIEREEGEGPEALDPGADRRRPGPVLVGRDAHLAQLGQWLARALGGARQVAFVTGDAGIGKTALVEGFIGAVVAREPAAVVARGQCVEHYGPAEPFLPILDALERLARQPASAWAASVVARHLPDALLSPRASSSATAPAGALMPERAVRLLGGAVEALAAERALILLLEDLHWSDPSTIDVLSYLARRPEPCRLLVLATYRPTDAILRRHPLRDIEQELRVHQRSVQLSLGRLDLESVRRWLDAVCPAPPAALVEWLHRRTDGHPLFVSTLLESLIAAGLVACGDGAWRVEPGFAEFGVPESLRLMIDRQAENLAGADRALLEAASAAGTRFSAASVAAAVEGDLISVEARCSALARDGHFVRAAGRAEWPDGTVAGAYEFIHELYRSTLYARLSPAHARLLHQRIGRRLEQGHGADTDEVATELSVHFTRARDPARAIRYLENAATQCTQRGAHREAVDAIQRALEILARVPDAAERADRMLFLNLRLGASLLVAEDYADPAAEAAFRTARQLAEDAGALPPLLAALGGLHTCYAARAQLAESEAIVPRMLELAAQLPIPQARLIAYACAAWSQWSRGELGKARESAAAAIAAQPDEPIPFPSTFDVVSYVFGISAFVEMASGDLDAAHARAREADAWSRTTARPVDRATALALIGMLHAFMDDPRAAAAHAEEAMTVAEEHGYRQWLAIARVTKAWTDAVETRTARALADLELRIEEYTRMGLRAVLSALLSLAAGAHARAGRNEAALALLARAEAHVRETGERWYEPELHRLRGAIAHADDPRRAQASFERAIDLARAQGARLWELRATVGLGTLWRREKKGAAARDLLEPVLSTFADDLDAPDLRAARALRAALA